MPLLLDLVNDDESKGVIKVISLPTALGYGHWVAPGVPKDRLAALRAAYAEVMKDPEFLKEAEKTGWHPRPGRRRGRGAGRQVIKAPKAVLDRTAQILKWK